MFYVGDSVAPVLSRRRILWVEAFAQGCSDGICANTQGHITRCARARGLAQFSGTYMRDIRCLRSAVLQPPGRTPAMVARGTQAFCLVRAMPFAPSMACPARGRSAPFLVLRAVPWRTILSYASLPCRRNGLRAWRPAPSGATGGGARGTRAAAAGHQGAGARSAPSALALALGVVAAALPIGGCLSPQCRACSTSRESGAHGCPDGLCAWP